MTTNHGNGLAKEISLRIRAKEPVLVIESFEEERVERMLAEIADGLKRELWTWTITEGLVRLDPRDLEPGTAEEKAAERKMGTNTPKAALEAIVGHHKAAIFILKDFTIEHAVGCSSSFIEDPVTMRTLRDIHVILAETRKTIVMTTPKAVIPLPLQKIITVLDMPFPTADELGSEELDRVVKDQKKAREDLQFRLDILKEDTLADAKKSGDKDQIDGVEAEIGIIEAEIQKFDVAIPKIEQQLKENRAKLIQAGRGLTGGEYSNVVSRCVANQDMDVNVIIREKKQIIRKSGLLEYIESDEDLASVGGNGVLKRWMMGAKKRLSEEAAKFGLDRPKGLLLIGPPGTGKSLSAKVVGNVLQVPILRLDMSQIASKWYGETSGNLSRALKLADAVAPCVLFIDELEKAMSIGGSGEGHEETMRTMATLLTHMEESRAGVFYVATCNNDVAIKPEMQARFPKIFFLDLPNKTARKEIFAIHLMKVHRDPTKFDLEALASATDGYVGREIRDIIQEALSAAFDKGEELTDKSILKAISEKVSGAQQKAAEIGAMRERLKNIALDASDPDKTPVAQRAQGVEFA